MSNEHFIPGKDASLEASIAHMQAQIERAGFHLEEHLWLNSIENVWSVLLRDADCPLLFSNGKGSSKLCAQASALGEFVERLSTNHFWSQAYLGQENAEAAFTHDPREKWFPLLKRSKWPAGLLTPELQKFYDPSQEIPAERLVDFNSGNVRRGIVALPFTRLSDAEKVWFPVNILNNLYVSNGMAAGNSLFEARVQALSEIIERAIKFRVIEEGLSLPDVPEECLSRYPSICAGIKRLKKAGFGIIVKDASLGGVFPVIAITLINPKDQGCFVSFGAHPSFEIALERALTELLQGRPLEALSGFPPPSFLLDVVASAPNLEAHFVDSSGEISWDFLTGEEDYSFVDWNFSSTIEADYHWLLACIRAEKHEVYCLDFTHLGIYSCRIIVPGMSEIYPVDDLDYDNNSDGIPLRLALLKLDDLDPEMYLRLRDLLDAFELPESLSLATVIGIAADPGSILEELRIGELKTWLALGIGEWEEIAESCEWLSHYGQINPERLKLYQCIETTVKHWETDNDDVPLELLSAFYGKKTAKAARQVLFRKQPFPGLPTFGEDFAACELHQKLLAAYAKVQRVKKASNEKSA